jgi:hypothetical protein
MTETRAPETATQHPSSSSPRLPSEALELLERGIEAARSVGGWRAYLEAQSRFHTYSARNAMLILCQCPDATRVAGFHTWFEFGRHVRRGERGLLILAPMVRRRLDEETGELIEALVGFRTAHVFDIAQTEGEPLPERPVLARLEGPNAAAQIVTERLEAALATWGFPVSRSSDLPDGLLGACEARTGAITLRADLSDVQALSTLLHETAHARLHSGGVCAPDKPVREFEAESVAFVVMHHLGFDTSGFSFGYLASYGATPETVRLVSGRVQSCAKALLAALEPAQAEG